MKKIQYSAGIKAAAVFLQELFAVILIVCIVLLTVLFDRSMVDMGDLTNQSFSRSGYYEELFKQGVTEVLKFVGLKELFETDGAYDVTKVIDTRNYLTRSGKAGGGKAMAAGTSDLQYYLKDLEDWSKGYVLLDSVVNTSFYIAEDGSMHQRQKVTVNGVAVQDSENNIAMLEDMSPFLQEAVVAAVQHYYGGYYEVAGGSAGSGSAVVVTENQDGSMQKDSKEQSGGSGESQTGNAPEAGSETQNGAEDSGTGESREDQDQALLQDSIQKAAHGELFDLDGDALRVLLEDLSMSEFQDEQSGRVVQETYLPVSGTTILDRFLGGEITLSQMNKAYEVLQFTLEDIGEQISFYKKCVNRYEKNESNLSYWIYTDGQTLPYTNIRDGKNGEELAAYGKKQGSYFYYSENEIRLDSNVKGMEEAYYDNLEKLNNGKNRVILVAVNTQFPCQDSFYEARAEYSSLQPWIMVSLVALLISAFGFFFSFIYLNMAAGRHSDDKEIHLCWFDRIKTEFLIGAFFLVCMAILYLYLELGSRYGSIEIAGLLVMSGGLTFTCCAVFLVLYLSLVRRIKASVMWTGSFLYWVGKGVQKVFYNRKPVTKILVFFSLHVLASMLIGVMLYRSYYAMSAFSLALSVLLFLILCGLEGVVLLREGIERNTIMGGIKKIAGGDLEYEIDTSQLKGENKSLGEAVNNIGDGLYHAVDDSMKNERLKADLITNVSHDIKTPLTSIINYVDLMKREDIPNPRVQGYIRILDTKSQRLKQLTEDLVEASKVSSGNVELKMDRINLVELVYQTGGEFNEKFEARGLTAVTKLPKEPVIIMADGRRIWRVIENLYNNVAKYAMMNTRVYVDMEVQEDLAAFSIKNISEQALNIDASELTERFIRGDVSRSTEGSGLGLSIAKDLTELMGGIFEIYLDGDLFKATITFPRVRDSLIEAGTPLLQK